MVLLPFRKSISEHVAPVGTYGDSCERMTLLDDLHLVSPSVRMKGLAFRAHMQPALPT